MPSVRPALAKQILGKKDSFKTVWLMHYTQEKSIVNLQSSSKNYAKENIVAASVPSKILTAAKLLIELTFLTKICPSVFINLYQLCLKFCCEKGFLKQ